MSVFFNRLSILAHGGSHEVFRSRREAWPTIHRFMVAQSLIRAGLNIPRAPMEAVRRLETRLRYLEQRGVIRVVHRKVYAPNTSVSLPDGSNSLVDITRTLAWCVWDSVAGDVQLEAVEKKLNEKQGILFAYHPDILSLSEPSPSWGKRVSSTVIHPLLKSAAYDYVAGHHLEDPHLRWVKEYTKQERARSERSAQSARELFSAMRHAQSTDFRSILAKFTRQSARVHIGQRAQGRGDAVSLTPPLSSPDSGRWAFVVSDVHLSDAPHPRREQFLRFLYMCFQLRATLVLNGDIFDYARPRSSLERIMGSNPEIWNAFAMMERVIFIYGNHDEEMKTIAEGGTFIHENLWAPKRGMFYDEGIFIEHGHLTDPLTREGTKAWRRGLRLVYYISQVWRSFDRWADLVVRIVLGRIRWKEYKVNQILMRVKNVYRDACQRELEGGHGPFTSERPFIYIRGHDHFFGDAFLEKAIRDAIRADKEIGGGQVQFFFSSAWKDREGYAGDVLAIDLTPGPDQQPQRTIFPLAWEFDHVAAIRPPDPPTPPPTIHATGPIRRPDG